VRNFILRQHSCANYSCANMIAETDSSQNNAIREDTPDSGVSLVTRAAATVARRMPACGVERDELVSVGYLALVNARAANPAASDGELFVRVRGAMLDELRARDHLSRGRRQDVRLVEKTRHALFNELGRPPLIPEIAARAAIPGSRVDAALYILDAGPEVVDFDAIPDERLDHQAAGDFSSLHDAIARLPERQAQAIRLCFLEGRTLDEVAGKMRISGERVRQIRMKALVQLKQILSGLIEADYEDSRACASKPLRVTSVIN
jgi:RNA polymerase sigma factor for flagellar operon FliA